MDRFIKLVIKNTFTHVHTIDCDSVPYSQLTLDTAMCEIDMACWSHIYIEHRNLEIQKDVTTSCSGTKPFY